MTLRNKRITSKTNTAKTILFASLIAAMILPFSVMDIAEAEQNTIRKEMKQIHDEMENALASEKEELKTKYFLKNEELNDSIYRSPPKDFVKEWKTLDFQAMDLIEQQYKDKKELNSLSGNDKALKQTEIDNRDLKIQEIRSQIDLLQSELLEFMKINPTEEKKLTNIVSDLHETYDNIDSAFVMGGIDYEQKKIVVELTTQFDDLAEFKNSSVGIAEKIRNLIGEENVIITIDSFELTTCTNYLGTCTPRVGGVAIARFNDSSNLAGSIGYKATKSGNTGYVTAGHVVDYYSNGNRKMLQPVGGSQISDGTGFPFTTSASSGDVSFQKTSVSINDDIYYSSNTKVDVASYATYSGQHSGHFVYKMGAGNGLTYGYVQTHWTVSDVWTTSASTAGGDSGGPIFNITGYSGSQYYGNVFGHAFMSYQGNAVYQPTEKIIANHGIYPATT